MLYDELKKELEGEVAHDTKTLDLFSRDASLFEVRPELVAFPKNVEDVKRLVRFVAERKKANPSLSLTGRSAGTDMSGGSINDSIIVNFTKHINRVKEVGRNYAVAEPGVFYRDFERETLKKGLLLPSYPASREICALGGMVSNNSGGEKTLAYGKTEDYVMELKVVLRDGEEYTFRALDRAELDAKMRQQDFEGEIYRKVYDLVDSHYDLVKSAKPKVSKNSAGYYLWDVWDREKEIFDLTKLFVGSQGTLGMLTEIKVRLVKPKKLSKLVAIFLYDLAPLAQLIQQILKHKPESFESYDDHTFKLAFRFWRDVLKILKPKSIFSLVWGFLPEARIVMFHGIPKLILLAEFTDSDQEKLDARVRKVEEAIRSAGLRYRVTRDEEDAKKYWVMRRESFNLLRKHLSGMRTAPFIDDVIVRPQKLPQFLPALNKILDKYKGLIYTVAGHAGDGNFHIIPLMDLKDEKMRALIPALSEEVYRLVSKFGGSYTAEHNDGLVRSPYLERMYGKEVYGLFEEAKKIFDPENIFNPRKKVGADLGYALRHIQKG